MQNSIQTSDQTGSCTDLLTGFGLIGLSDSIGVPGTYTCFQHLANDELRVGILPGNFSSAEVIELFRAADLIARVPKAA